VHLFGPIIVAYWYITALMGARCHSTHERNQHRITSSSSALEEDSEYLILELLHFHCTYVILSILTFFKQTIIMFSNTRTHTKKQRFY
jgi:hypothetical protein